ncbi:hypothetical protein OV090_38300 [Nannocystis sp. RBIL2]|uniref:hypothetical protein n=1 Tax=Nannocystis sp. RBIL2 TaxID=2996788 RepID=UPI00226E0DC8|nr:hypothetical protein [Nannocystis sp. RBIL2]MCY1070656.1 hypothetical protein [Nannocystis sp. RBIL2]
MSTAWAALDGGGSCTHAEWHRTTRGSGFLHECPKHTSDTQKSGATYVTANDSAVVFLGYARGIGELEVGADSVEVGTAAEHQGAPEQAYDSFLLLVRP